MPSTTKLALYIAFLLALAVWMGGGVFESIASHRAWYADPVGYTRAYAAPRGTVNPWPFTTAVLALCTLAALAAFARHRGPGRGEVLAVLATVLVVLAATGIYFVPTLFRLADHAALTDAQITSLSRTWIRLNVLRMALLLGVFAYALVGLVRLVKTPPGLAPG